MKKLILITIILFSLFASANNHFQNELFEAGGAYLPVRIRKVEVQNNLRNMLEGELGISKNVEIDLDRFACVGGRPLSVNWFVGSCQYLFSYEEVRRLKLKCSSFIYILSNTGEGFGSESEEVKCLSGVVNEEKY